MSRTIKYFYDCEFLEGPQKKRFLGLPYGETINTIDLISIGVVSEDDRELYLVSKDFNLKEAWNRFQIEEGYNYGDMRNHVGDKWQKKVYWIRENVLKPIWDHFIQTWAVEEYDANRIMCSVGYDPGIKFTYRNFKKLLNKYGKSRESIKIELATFLLVPNGKTINDWLLPIDYLWNFLMNSENIRAELWGYYSAYDHVCLSWIFGKMIDLPKGVNMYTKDLKQMYDGYVESQKPMFGENFDISNHVRTLPDYPVQNNCHDALDDAKWNKRLYEFLMQR